MIKVSRLVRDSWNIAAKEAMMLGFMKMSGLAFCAMFIVTMLMRVNLLRNQRKQKNEKTKSGNVFFCSSCHCG